MCERQLGSCNRQHVGAVSSERASANGSGDDAGEIQNANARQWPRTGRTLSGLCVADPRHLEDGQRRQGSPLRMRLPFFRRPRHRGDEPARDGFVFEGLAVPASDRFGHALARIFCTQHRQHPLAVMREIGVNAHETPIARAIDAKQRIERAVVFAFDAEIALAAKFDRGVAHIDGHILRAASSLSPDFGGRERTGGDGRLRDRPHGERGGQCRLVTGQVHSVEGRRFAPAERPNFR